MVDSANIFDNTNNPYIYWFDELSIADVVKVGGKNASLGEMITAMAQEGIAVPTGFATSAQLFRDFLSQNKLDEPIKKHLQAYITNAQSLAVTGSTIRQLISQGEFTAAQQAEIIAAYQQLSKRLSEDSLENNISVAVRSSATAEDLPEASFAGQQESYLNITGESELLESCRQCFASLYTDRAIVYRQEQGFSHQQVALSVGIQQMLNSHCAGVMFSLDTETGFPDVIVINGAWGLGETIVKGTVTPDNFMVYKPLLSHKHLLPIIEKRCGSKRQKMLFSSSSQMPTITLDTSADERATLVLSDDEILTLARWAVKIEQHYGCAMDMEWAKDTDTQQLYIVQARPETVESQKADSVLVNYTLKEKSAVLVEGASVGSAIASGEVFKIDSPADIEQFPEGAVLVTQRTDPDWVPIMRKAAGIITDSGGPTSHAAIVSRELKVAAIVGCENATQLLQNDQAVTLSCAEGAIGKVYQGKLAFKEKAVNLAGIPKTKTDIMINAAMPDGIFRWWSLPVAGIGLTRIEFIISSQICLHPMALLQPEKINDDKTRAKIDQLTHDYQNPADYFVDKLALGVGKIAASQYPKPVIVRMSDFKSNEYRGLLAGEFFEIEEENPMLGLRGASRYYHPLYRDAFKLECQAIIKAREEMGFDNIIVMIPFCRTPSEADKVLAVMAEAGLARGDNGLQVYVMCEIEHHIS